ncbi:MAG: DUF3795 domain-containing protein, partial [Deltaproteobacteria bacterium]|nr:DUF3795 domain-containing protein [Deltaproteobacteria bacterium]
MKTFNPDTYCGIYCGACSIVTHAETGCTDAFAACLKSVPKEELACGGCKSDNIYAGCGTCSLRQCARGKGVEHCIDCADYPCRSYSKWQSSANFIVPHSREAAASLELIKREGITSWLGAQKKRWSCPDCGLPFSWYAPECCNCGRKLASEAFELSGWRKLLCRIILPMVYR